MKIARKISAALFYSVMGVSGAATFAGFLSERAWIFDLAAAFRAVYLPIQLAGTIFFFVRKKWLGALALLACVAANGQQIAPLYLSARQEQAEGSSPATRIKILQLNAGFRHASPGRIASYALAVDADVVAIEELANAPGRLLEKELAGRYPHRFVFPVDTGAGLGMFSKLPLRDPQIVYFADPGLPSVVAGLQLEGGDATIVVTHPLSPTTPYGYRLRNRQLAAIARSRPEYSERLIVVGDLNVTSWSGSFSDLLEEARLRDTRTGFGIQPTWPSLGFRRAALVPIDHCLVSEHFEVVSRRVGEDVGSDHLPIVVELELIS